MKIHAFNPCESRLFFFFLSYSETCSDILRWRSCSDFHIDFMLDCYHYVTLFPWNIMLIRQQLGIFIYLPYISQTATRSSPILQVLCHMPRVLPATSCNCLAVSDQFRLLTSNERHFPTRSYAEEKVKLTTRLHLENNFFASNCVWENCDGCYTMSNLR